MQVIPVIDIKGGLMVHAVGGQRDNYIPIKSKLFSGASPETAVKTLKGMGFNQFYIADLDAIDGEGNNFDLIKKIASIPNIKIWLDAGLSKPGDAQPVMRYLGAVNLIVGSETLADFNSLPYIVREIGARKTIFSLDLKKGKLLTQDRSLQNADPIKIARRVFAKGINNIIVLELSSVGKETGFDTEILSKLKKGIPEARIYPGGGVRNVKDIILLKELKMAGVLIATALYKGAINPQKVIY